MFGSNKNWHMKIYIADNVKLNKSLCRFRFPRGALIQMSSQMIRNISGDFHKMRHWMVEEETWSAVYILCETGLHCGLG